MKIFTKSQLVACGLLAAGPAVAERAPPKPVMVFAIAYDNRCDGPSFYTTEMADSSTYTAARNALKKRFEEKYPKAQGVRAGSSKFEFGDQAAAVSIIEVDNSTPSCSSHSIVIHFGVDLADAKQRSEKAAGKRSFKTLKQEYFVKTETAPAP